MFLLIHRWCFLPIYTLHISLWFLLSDWSSFFIFLFSSCSLCCFVGVLKILTSDSEELRRTKWCFFLFCFLFRILKELEEASSTVRLCKNNWLKFGSHVTFCLFLFHLFEAWFQTCLLSEKGIQAWKYCPPVVKL